MEAGSKRKLNDEIKNNLFTLMEIIDHAWDYNGDLQYLVKNSNKETWKYYKEMDNNYLKIIQIYGIVIFIKKIRHKNI